MYSEIGIAIVAHESRIDMASELQKKVNNAPMFVDDGTFGEWRNHERAWRWLRINFRHGIVLQDDAIVSDTFVEDAEKAVRARPRDCVSFYTGTGMPYGIQGGIRQAVQRAEKENLSWLVSSRLWWGVGVAMPSAYVPTMLDSYTGLPYDQHIGGWCQKAGIRTSYTYPSLVDHDYTVESLVGKGLVIPERRAHSFGRQKNPRDQRSATFGL